MELTEILTAGGTGFAIILLGMIKIPKLELNIWGWLAQGLGKALNREVMKELTGLKHEVNVVKKELQNHIKVNDERDAMYARQRILKFNDEVIDNIGHTKESFNCILEDIDSYEQYCDENPDFPNNRCVMAIENIRETYKQCMHNKQF